MSAPPTEKGAPIAGKNELIEYLESGCRPPDEWRIGTEHEKFVFTTDDLKPLPYEGEGERPGIRDILEGLAALGWEPVLENGNPIALKHDGCNITLEPGGQLELSGAPVRNLHETCNEVNQHLAQAKQVAEPLGVGMLGMGFAPDWRREDVPWMPKGRYDVMRRYMPRVGSLGIDMMVRTCTVQVNLDFKSEADMVKKFRVGLALQPVATALFANSPFTEGRPNGFVSYRSHIWTDTDPDRTGMMPFVFDEGFGFERYVEHVLDVPMYFVYRDGKYIDASGQSFRDFLDGKLPALPGERPYMSDWSDHLTTLFPEVRLKKFLEMRGADGGPWNILCALPALWVGLLYSSEALDAAWDLVKDWTHADRQALRDVVPRQGLRAPFRDGTVRDLAKRVLEIADHGLRRRDTMDGSYGQDERQFLTALRQIVETGETPADEKLRRFHEEWGEKTAPLYKHYIY
ncbi:glutamate--cysteine ligase [Ferruginivarius sediminum]|uniref:Glutamate--cysteine ligase n=1 Tax=Ferruginivarius sediminum TaxID=2661937 RepID=A0A369THA3_9PROT|nr:glutamate--cysteine ligase [Ferruginivarius sediminum]RDD63517.1 glutamate--cysteine ligase [Ferruginivarius sediminum]